MSFFCRSALLRFPAVILVFGLVFGCFASTFAAEDTSPKDLDRYIALEDNTFQWSIVETFDDENFLLEMTSQTWHGIAWKHFILVSLPKKPVYPKHATLYITGKGIGKKPGTGDQVLGRTLSNATGMISVMLFQVPNQPLLGGYSEDALIGETLLKALETEDTTWPLLFPMAKSAVRAMDAVQAFLKQQKNLDVEKFVVTGASKRGWTTWLTAATRDARVVAIAPIVIDTLNLPVQMQYQIETWGHFSPSIHDYTDRKLVNKDEPEFTGFKKNLWQMIDPYSYRSRLTLPKMLVHGTNDPYWTVDATKNYWNELSGVKYILTLPNAGHGLDAQLPKAVQSIAVFARHAAEGADWPRLDWKLEEKNDAYTVTLDTDLPKERVRLWTARSDSKDFRKAKWESTKIDADALPELTIPKPTSGHLAFYVEIESDAYGLPFALTTQVWRF